MSYSEQILNGNLIITVKNPRTDWKEWIQTLEEFDPIPYKIQTFSNGYIVSLPELYIKKNPVVGKLFKQVFRKAAYCVSCGTCQSNCVYGCLSLQNGVHIQDCKHCLQCHDIENGCHTYASLKIPIEELKGIIFAKEESEDQGDKELKDFLSISNLEEPKAFFMNIKEGSVDHNPINRDFLAYDKDKNIYKDTLNDIGYYRFDFVQPKCYQTDLGKLKVEPKTIFVSECEKPSKRRIYQ